MNIKYSEKPELPCGGRRLVTLMLALSCSFGLLSSCFVFDSILPATTTKKKFVPTPQPTPEVTEEETPKPAALTGGRLLRRIALNFAGMLPTPSDVDAFVADSSTLTDFIGLYLATPESAKNIALLHKRMWHLDPNNLGDLETAAGGPTLSASMRRDIVEEPLQLLRFVYEQEQSFSKIFTSSYGVVSSNLQSEYTLTAGDTAWFGESYNFVSYSDSRPAAGIFTSNGFQAAFSGRDETVLRHRAYKMFSEIACLDVEYKYAHLFGDLTDEEMAAGPLSLVTTRSPCVGCHAHFEYPGKAMQGMGTGASFADWENYSAPSDASGYYAGHSFSGLAAMADYVGNDPRVHRCEIKKLISTVLQRPFFARDEKLLQRLLEKFYSNDLNLKEVVELIALNEESKFAILTKEAKDEYIKEASGIRFLSADLLRNIFEQISYAASSIDIPEEINPGIDEHVSGDFAIPSGTYFHHLLLTAKHAASVIVDEELADNTLPASRKLFSRLPSGAGRTSSEDINNQQIKDLWKILMSEDIDEAGTEYPLLQTLWTASLAATAGAGTTEDDTRQAWRTMLVGFFTHPRFVMY